MKKARAMRAFFFTAALKTSHPHQWNCESADSFVMGGRC
jgi:hypothetical protein